MTATLAFSSGAYTYSPDPGDSFTYSSSGALTSETDAAGETLNITYASPAPGTGNCPATASWCQTITSASGRALTLGYNSSNLVTTVTDPMARRWTYAYTGSDLTLATDPMGNKTSYTYGAGSTGNPQLANDLLTITGPNAQPGGPDAGDSTVNVYDSFGRVTSQTDPMGNVTSFNYCVSVSRGDCMNTATGTGMTTVTDPDGNTTIDSYSLGSQTGEADLTGGTTVTSAQAFAPDQSGSDASAGTQLDTADVDSNGNVTMTTYGVNGNPIATVSPDGVGSQTATTTDAFTALADTNCSSTAEASATCTGSPGPSAVAPGGVITPPTSIPPQGLTWTLYDTDGNELYSTTGVYEPGVTTAAYSQNDYSLYAGNSVTLGANHITCGATPPSASLPCATIDADGVVTQLAYNAQGALTSSSTPDGNGAELAITSYGYDSDGEQTSESAPDGNLTGANSGNFTTVTAFNSDGQPTSVSQGDGTGHTVTPRVTQYGYDGDNNRTSVEDARGFTTMTGFNADDEATLVTDPDSNATLTCYDPAGDIVQTVPPAGVVANGLNPGSCPTTYPAGYSTRLAADATVDTYDTDGNLTQETTPAPAGQTGFETTSYTYDGNGNVATTTEPATSNGGSPQVTVDTYNDADELVSETTGFGSLAASTVSYCFDPNGDTSSVVSADGNATGVAGCETSAPWVVSATSHPTQAAHQTSYGYDSVGELVSTTAPATTAAPTGATTTASYDPAGNRLTSTDPNGVTTTMTYTPTDQVATVSYSGSSAHSVGNTFDADGNLTAMTDGAGSSSYSYDSFDELTSDTNGASQTVGYSYDPNGQISSIAYPLPVAATWATTNSVTYGYDHASQLTSVTDFNGNQISISNTADGLPTSATLGTTGDTIATTYDNTDTPSLIKLKNSSTTLQSFTYSDAPSGDILSETDTPSSSRSPVSYTYDAQGRLTSMTPGTGSLVSYAVDASGNLTTLPNGATAGYDNAGELTSSSLSGTSTSYTYDADGERLTSVQGATTLSSGTWNGAEQLASYDDGAANMTAAVYDGNSMRASTTITPAGGSAITQHYVWGGDSLLMDGSNAYVYTGQDAPGEQVSLSAGTVTYLNADLIRSIRGTVNSSGTLTGTMSYDAWGNPTTAGGLTATTPFGFAGGYTDPDGLIYLINRYYDPATGQFTSVDPDVDQTEQPYAYADTDPVDQSDPDGLYAELYRQKCGGHVCANIVKRCGSDNKCGLYYGFKLQPKWKKEKEKEVGILLELFVNSALVLPGPGPHYPVIGPWTGSHVWYRRWGFAKGHDWGYYCGGGFGCKHMAPDDLISLGISGYVGRYKHEHTFGVEFQWPGRGKRRPWHNSYIRPKL